MIFQILNMQSSIWIKLFAYISVLLSIGLFWALYIGSEGATLNQELRNEQQELQKQLNFLMSQNSDLESQIREMQNSDLYVEAFARGKLGLIKSEEHFISNKVLHSDEPN